MSSISFKLKLAELELRSESWCSRAHIRLDQRSEEGDLAFGRYGYRILQLCSPRTLSALGVILTFDRGDAETLERDSPILNGRRTTATHL